MVYNTGDTVQSFVSSGLSKRLIAVIVLEGSWVVQTFGYGQGLPIGKVENVVVNLCRWGVDEIVVLDRLASKRQIGINFDAVNRIADLQVSIPLAYGGGVTSRMDAQKILRAGFEKVVVDRLISSNQEEAESICVEFGSQAVIATMPLICLNGTLFRYHHWDKSMTYVTPRDIESLFQGYFGEVLLVDVTHEGGPRSFDVRLLNIVPREHVPVIAFGGIENPQVARNIWNDLRVSAVAVSNSLNYQELAADRYKKHLDGPLRPSRLSTSYSWTHGAG